MSILGLDCETDLILPGRGAPPLVSVAFCRGDEYELVHQSEAEQKIVAKLEGDEVLVGFNTAFDMVVMCAEYPKRIPLVFEVYAADRVTDVDLREQLQHIALGVHHKFQRLDGEVVHLGYSLSDLVRRHLKVEMDKGSDTFRLRYGELRDVPVAWWPKEAVDYAVFDAVVLPPIYERQEQAREYLKDEFRQARAAFWIQLMEVWGIPINIEGVRAFAKKTQQKFTRVMDELEQVGLARRKNKAGDWARCEKKARQRMVEVCRAAGREPEMTEPSRTHPTGQAKIDADNCERSGDPVMEKYGEASSLMKTLSTDLPLLLGASKKRGATTAEDKAENKEKEKIRRVLIDRLIRGERVDVHRIFTRFDPLKNSGRTGSAPNVQNWPTEVGMRECVEPEEGNVFVVADYSGFELRTWSQCCVWMFGQSRMADALNAGRDPHVELACRIMKVSYEEAAESYARDRKGPVYYPRQTGKVGNFGLPGGLREFSLVEYARKNYGVILTVYPEFGSKLVSASELIEFWHDAWPESHDWFERLKDMTEEEHAQLTQFVSERVRGDVSFTDGANTLFQGLAADAAKAAGFLIARACYAEPDSPLYGWRPFNFVHDEFCLSGPDGEGAHDAAQELARLMKVGAEPFLPDVPAEVEALLCRRWSKAAKPLYDLNRRLVPWDFGVEDRMKAEGTLWIESDQVAA